MRETLVPGVSLSGVASMTLSARPTAAPYIRSARVAGVVGSHRVAPSLWALMAPTSGSPNYLDDTVSKIDVSTNTVTATVAVGDRPTGVAFDGSNIWVANSGDDTVSKIVP